MVEVVWYDAHAVTDTWTMISELDGDPCVVRSVGLLLPHSKPGHLMLAQSVTSDDMVDSVLAVPLGMVKRVHLLTVGVLLPVEPISSDDEATA